jgi:hypothetical protein
MDNWRLARRNGTSSEVSPAMDYIVVYDILRDGIGVAPIFVCVGMLLGLCVGIGVLVSQRKQRKPVGCLIVWLILWSLGVVVGGGNVLYQHFRCAAWARSGNFDVTEGQVTEFRPLAKREKGNESFTVQGLTFSYSSSNLSQGGFRYELGPDGLLQEGSQVRISHREGRILKLEIQKD